MLLPAIFLEFYELVVGLSAKGVKGLISIGGWGNSDKSVGWSHMFSDAALRARFVKSVVEFLKLYKFCGLDIDFEYPACPQGDRSAGKPSDADHFNKLVRELKHAFDGKYLLTVTVSAGKKTLKECFNMPELCHIGLDWINMMAYDYYSWRDGSVAGNAPICGSHGKEGVYDSLVYMTSVCECSANQLVLGVPFYGQSYTLANPSEHEFGAKASGPGEAGDITKSNGTLAYYEICLNQKNGWNTGSSKTDDSYIWKGSQFVSYDDIIDLKRKLCFGNVI